MIEHGFNLFSADAGKPLKELRDCGSVAQVLKQGGHWHAGATKDQGATHFIGVIFHSLDSIPRVHVTVSFNVNDTGRL
jgi:hypothetical protein